MEPKTEPGTEPKLRREPARALGIALAALAVVFAGATALIFRRLHASLPQLDGTVRVAGLKAPVEVLRDARGVPHIRAAWIEDAGFAQGYATAQDRLWQMDLSRRLASGELSEIFGKRTLPLDIERRTLGFHQVAERGFSDMDADSRAFLIAYTQGVNAFISSHGDHLPVEFTLLGYKPQPWTPADSAGIALNMARILSNSWPTDLMRERIQAKLGPELTGQLFPNRDPLDRPVAEPVAAAKPPSVGALLDQPSAPSAEIAGGAYGDRGVVGGGNSLLAALDGQLDAADFVPGSNNWVVSGAHTRSGKPLLANDPHLGHSIPSIWYMVGLESPGLHVEGVSLPGAPGVIIGHNERIAWGMTNTGPDVQDLFIEKFDPQDPTRYLHNGHWEKAEVRDEVIQVKGEPDYHLTVRVTRHGPIITPLLREHPDPRDLALEWTALEPHALRFPMLKMDEAGNWQEFTTALRDFTGPEQNMVYADVDGNIGYYAPAWVPIRKHGHGSVPEPGDTDDYDWTGYIPFADLPHAYNPPGGIIATANSRVVPDGYPYFITDEWAPAWRTARIFQLLEAGSNFTVADMLRIQMDIHSLSDEWLAKRLVAAGNVHPPADPEVARALDLLRNWDGEARRDSAATWVCEATRPQLLKRVLAPRLGDDLSGYSWSLSSTFLQNAFDQHWTQWLPPGDADFDDTLMKSLEAGVRTIRKSTGSDSPSAWVWGDTIPLTFHHPLDAIPFFGSFFDVGPFPQWGMSNTVKATTPGAGPSMRLVVDFGDLEQSVNNLTLGESGQLASPYYSDQFEAWYHGSSFPMAFSGAAVDAAAVHRLTLKPE